MALLKKIEKQAQQTSIFDDKIKYVANFLLEHYDIRVSVQDPTKRFIKCKDKDREHITPTLSEISLHLAANNYQVSESRLRQILKSPYYIPHCDPIKEYFDGLRGKWSGISQIDLLCSHIHPRVWDDKTPEFYRERSNKLLRKWMVACVACWVGGIPNETTLGLIQAEGGVGKTFFAKWILPECLSGYFVKASRDPKKFDIENAYTRYMVVNYDELEGITKSNINQYKTCQTDDRIMTRIGGEEIESYKKRIAVSLFSTNYNQENGGWIQQWFGSDTRRFGCIETESIDKIYSEKVDKDQMWAEALTLYENSSVDYLFKEADWADFNEYNARYRYETDSMKIVQRFVRMPYTGEEGEKLNPTQIMHRLISMGRLNGEEQRRISPQKIGQALTALGYNQISFRSILHNNESVKGYEVVFVEKK